MRTILIGAAALVLSTAATAQSGQAPTAPPNGSLPTGATTMQGTADSGSGAGTMQSGNESMASDPATTDRGATKPHARHHSAKSSDGSAAQPR